MTSLLSSYGFSCSNDLTADNLIKAFDTIINQNKDPKSELHALLKEFKKELMNSKELQTVFQQSNKLNLNLINSPYFVSRYLQGFRPYPLSNNVECFDSKVIWLIKGWDKYVAKYSEYDFVYIDYSPLPLLWQKLFIRYTLSTDSRSCIAEMNSTINRFNQLIQFKERTNSSLTVINALDVSFLKSLSNPTSVHDDYYNKSFLTWLNGIPEITVNPEAIKELSFHLNAPSPKPIGISDYDFRILLNKYIENATDDYGFHQLAILLLLRTTKIRLDRILALDIKDIIESQKKNQFIIVDETKTSNGKKENYGISKQTYELLIKSRSISEAHENKALTSYKGKIFLSAKNSRVKLYSAVTVEKYMSVMCKQASLKRYLPRNVRKTYMTAAVDFTSENNYGDLVEEMLTGHKSNTITRNNYFDYDISRVVECTYGITIGDQSLLDKINADKHIKDSTVALSNLVGNEESIGYCIEESSCQNALLPCWLCSFFYTTPDFLPVFINELKKIREKYKESKSEHDRENMETQMEVLGIYIAAILQHMKEKKNDISGSC